MPHTLLNTIICPHCKKDRLYTDQTAENLLKHVALLMRYKRCIHCPFAMQINVEEFTDLVVLHGSAQGEVVLAEKRSSRGGSCLGSPVRASPGS